MYEPDVTTVVTLPFAEGFMCRCGELWWAVGSARTCGHVPGSGRRRPPPLDRWRAAARRHRYSAAERFAGWLLVAVLVMYGGLVFLFLLA